MSLAQYLGADWRKHRFGARGGFTAYWRAKLDEDPQLRDLTMCVDLLLGGDRQIRIASRSMTTTSGDDGQAFDWLPLLQEEPDIDSMITKGQGGSTVRSIQIAFPAFHLRPAEAIAKGRRLSGTGEVSLNVPGGDHDHRIRLMAGIVDGGVSWGSNEDGWVTCALSDPLDAGNGIVPPWVATAETWPNLDPGANGQRYPFVLNEYTFIPAVAVDVTVGATKYLFAHGWGWSDAGTPVRVNGVPYAAANAEYAWAFEETRDARGVPVTVVTFSGTHVWDFTEAVHVAASGGTGPYTLIAIIRQLVEGYSTIGPDGAHPLLFAEAEAALGPVRPVSVINGSSSESAARVLDFVEGDLLRSFPMVSMLWWGGGYGPVVYDRMAPAVMSLEVGAYPLISRVTDPSESPANTGANNFTIRYDYDALGNQWLGCIVRDPTNSVICNLSMVGDRERWADVLELAHVADDGEAGQVADWLVAHEALPSVCIEHDAYPCVLLWLHPGSNVNLTDAEQGWSDVRATVERLDYQRGRVVLGFRVWAHAAVISSGGGAGTAVGPGGGQA